MLTKKEIERFHVNQLIQLCPNFFAGYLDEGDRERPDFIFHTVNEEKIGIEHTRLYRPKINSEKHPLQETISLKEKVVEETERVFLDRYGLPLHAGIAFQQAVNISKHEVFPLASEISDFIYSELKNKDLASHFSIRNQPSGILSRIVVSIRASYFPNVTASVWQVSEAYLIPDLEEGFIVKSVQKKEEDARKYLSDFDKVYLLLVIESSGEPATWFDKLEIPPPSFFEKFCFEKIFLLKDLYERIIKIK